MENRVKGLLAIRPTLRYLNHTFFFIKPRLVIIKTVCFFLKWRLVISKTFKIAFVAVFVQQPIIEKLRCFKWLSARR